MNNFPHLFEPIEIGKTTVKNRIFMPPISTNMADKGYVTDDLVAHYSARAKGGVGLIVTEVVTVEPTYVYLPGDMSIYDDSFIPGWKKLVDGVHQYGTKILAQLFHPAYMAFPVPGTPQLIAPSCVGPYYAQSAPRPATHIPITAPPENATERALFIPPSFSDIFPSTKLIAVSSRLAPVTFVVSVLSIGPSFLRMFSNIFTTSILMSSIISSNISVPSSLYCTTGSCCPYPRSPIPFFNSSMLSI